MGPTSSAGEAASPSGRGRSPRGRRLIWWAGGVIATLVVMLGLLWSSFRDDVVVQAWQLEREAADGPLEEAKVTVERASECFRLRCPTITEFEASLPDDADPDEVGEHLAFLAEEHGEVPLIHLDENTRIHAFDRFSPHADLPAEGWTDVVRMAQQEEVLEIGVGASRDGETSHVTLRHWQPVHHEALESLHSWEELEAPAGADSFSARMDAGLPEEPLERTPESPWLLVEPVHIGAPLGEGNPAIAEELLEQALAEDAFGEVRSFEHRVQEEGGEPAVCVRLGLRGGQLEDTNLRSEDPPAEVLEAAEQFADRAEELTKFPTTVRVEPHYGFGEVVHRELPDRYPCS